MYRQLALAIILEISEGPFQRWSTLRDCLSCPLQLNHMSASPGNPASLKVAWLGLVLCHFVSQCAYHASCAPEMYQNIPLVDASPILLVVVLSLIYLCLYLLVV